MSVSIKPLDAKRFSDLVREYRANCDDPAGADLQEDIIEFVMENLTEVAAALAHDEQAEPVAWRVRVKSDDPEEWSLLPAGGGADYLRNPAYEVQPLYAAPDPEHASVPGAELVDYVDVSAFGVWKGHAIPIDVCRHIAKRVNEKHAEALAASPRSAS